MKHTFFTALFLLTLALSFTNCDNNHSDLKLQDEQTNHHNVSEIPIHELFSSKTYQAFEKTISNQKKNNLNSKQTGIEFELEFTSSKVLLANTEQQKAYTVAVREKNGKYSDYSLNLLVRETDLGSTTFLIKYPKETGDITIHPVNQNWDDTTSKASLTSKSSGNCEFIYWEVTTPCGCSPAHTSGSCQCHTPYTSNSGTVFICYDVPIEVGTLPGGSNGSSSGGSTFGNPSGIPTTDDANPPIYIYEGEEECFSDGTCTPPLYWAEAQADRIYIENIHFSPEEIGTAIDIFLLENNNSEDARKSTELYERIASNNLLFSPFSQEFMEKAYCCGPILITDPTLGLKYYNHVNTQIAIIKSEYPSNYDFSKWELAKIYMEANLDAIQIGLDIIGLFPVVGEIADIINGVIYTVKGEGLNASLSFAAAIPIAGWAGTGAKWAIRATQASTIGTKIRLTWRVLSDGSIYFGSSGSKLRKVLGIANSALQAHHLIPWTIRNHNVVQKAAKSKSAFHINEALNGIAVASWRNQPNHNIYNNLISSKLDDFNNLNPNATIDEAYNFISDLTSDIRDWVVNNPNSHLNNLILP